jgi:hypothetical protein
MQEALDLDSLDSLDSLNFVTRWPCAIEGDGPQIPLG